MNCSNIFLNNHNNIMDVNSSNIHTLDLTKPVLFVDLGYMLFYKFYSTRTWYRCSHHNCIFTTSPSPSLGLVTLPARGIVRVIWKFIAYCKLVWPDSSMSTCLRSEISSKGGTGNVISIAIAGGTVRLTFMCRWAIWSFCTTNHFTARLMMS